MKITLFNRLGHDGFKKYLNNTVWLMLEKVFRIINALVVGVWVARFLGPDNYGLLSYALALASFLMPLSALGLEEVLKRDLIKKNPKVTRRLLGSSFILRLGSSFLCVLFIGSVYYFTDKPEIGYLFIFSISLLFDSFLIISFLYESQTKGDRVAIAKVIGMLISSTAKVLAIVFNASIEMFIVAFVSDNLITAVVLIASYYRDKLSLFEWEWDAETAKSLLIESWPLILSGIMIMLYMRIDQVMLKSMVGPDGVGYYSAATRISEAWYFVPVVICNALFPALVNSKLRSPTEYTMRSKGLVSLLVTMSLGAAIVVNIISGFLINFLYGEAFASSALVLSYHIWAGIWVSVGLVANKLLLINKMQKLSLYNTVLGAVLNVFLNFLLIPKYAIAGAAMATVVSQFVASFFALLLWPRTRGLFLLLLNGLVPGKYMLIILRNKN